MEIFWKDSNFKNHIVTLTYEEPSDFLDKVNILGYENEIDPVKGWVFRGQANENWNLLPNAFRKSTKSHFSSENDFFPLNAKELQFKAEIKYLTDFIKLADRADLYVPFNDRFFTTTNDWGENIINDLKKRSWIWHSQYSEMFAFAQHHRVPTRLLDFTKDPFIALYFATIGYIKKENGDNSNPCIWALNIDLLKSKIPDFNYKNLKNEDKTKQRYKSIWMPWSRNTYLHRQKGLFIIDIGADYCKNEQTNEYMPMENVIQCIPLKSGDKEPLLIKLVLKMKNQDENKYKTIWEYMKRNDYTPAFLEPSYANIIETCKIY